MKGIIKGLDRIKPFFEKFTANTYMTALRDGFIMPMYVILFSSIFLLIVYVPNAFGFYWSDSVAEMLIKPYNATMGFFGLIVCGTISKALTDIFNKNMPAVNQINSTATMIASICCYLLMLGDGVPDGMSLGYMGSKGLFAGIIIAFIVPNIYKFCIKNNITIRLPKEVPGTIAATFKMLIPFSFAVIFFWLFDMAFRSWMGVNLAEALTVWLSPLFALGNTYWGIAIIWGATAFFCFIGIHGPSVVHPAITAVWIANLEANQAAYQAGQQATNAFTETAYFMTGAVGGTGATLMITIFFAFLSKSKELKAVGKASIIPVLFGVNEPILFGGPLILNPIFFIPFIGAPVAGGLIYKFFVDVLGMNAFSFQLPWTTPAPIGTVIGTGFDPLSIVMAIVILAAGGLIYYPFFKVYDAEKVREEAEGMQEEAVEETLDEVMTTTKKIDDPKNVLVLCIGGGTSGLLANALKEAAVEQKIAIDATAAAYGTQGDILQNFDAVILAPQAATVFDELKKDTDRHGIQLATTNGREYIELTRNPEKALKFALKLINGDLAKA